MNFFDKTVATFAPVHAVKRAAARKTLQILNSGYGDGGASHSKKSMRGFTATSKSPLQDIDANHSTLVSRSRSLYMTAPIATGAIKTTVTNVVGSGLKLKSRIDFEFLGMTEDEAEKWEANTEREFELWANSRMCDALRLNSFYEMQGIMFKAILLNGDGFCLNKYEKPTKAMPYGLRLQLLEGDRVSTPNAMATSFGNDLYMGVNPDNGNRIYSGVEVDKNGATVAYWICNQYPYNGGFENTEPLKWQRVEMYGAKTGRQNLIHCFDAERAEQRRGVPMLAPVIEELKQLKRYTDAELMAAVISGMFTVFITTDAPSTENPLGQGYPDGEQSIDNDINDYQLGNGAIVTLNEGEKIDIADPKRPNTAFDGFVNALCKNIGTALEIPQELLLKSFNSSYSASRAALLEAWKMFKKRRKWLSNEFCQPVYELFLTEAIALGRIKADGFFDDAVVRKAWCGAAWNGAAMGMVDPTKEVQAAQMRVENGFSTREEETMGLTGGDYKKNAKQLKRENIMLADAQVSESIQAKGGE